MIEYSAGIVTAYGSAVRAGYTGTYEDFCRQQAQYAENAQAVEQAKQTAVSASQSANQAKQDAQTASTTAQQSAQSAQGSAQSAGQSAQDAQTAESNAQTYAQSASQSAGSAQQSAQTAQAVFESIPEDYSDLSKDVDKLKADLEVCEDKLGTHLYTESVINGTVPNPGNATAVATADFVPAVKGDTVKISTNRPVSVDGNKYVYYFYEFDQNGTRIKTYDSPILTADEYIVSMDATVKVKWSILEYTSSDVNVPLREGDFDGYSVYVEVIETDSLSNRIQNAETNVSDITNTLLNNGVFDVDNLLWVNGTLTKGNVTTGTKYRVVTSNILDVKDSFKLSVAPGFRFFINTYDENGTMTGNSGWQTPSYNILSGQRIRIVIARTTENTSEIADIDTFVASLTKTDFTGDIIEAQDALRVISNFTWIDGYAINVATGIANVTGSYSCTDFIPINGSRLMQRCYMQGVIVGTAFYDVNKKFISGAKLSDFGVSYESIGSIDIPDKAVFFRMSAITVKKGNQTASWGGRLKIKPIVEEIGLISGRVKSIEDGDITYSPTVAYNTGTIGNAITAESKNIVSDTLFNSKLYVYEDKTNNGSVYIKWGHIQSVNPNVLIVYNDYTSALSDYIDTSPEGVSCIKLPNLKMLIYNIRTQTLSIAAHTTKINGDVILALNEAGMLTKGVIFDAMLHRWQIDTNCFINRRFKTENDVYDYVSRVLEDQNGNTMSFNFMTDTHITIDNLLVSWKPAIETVEALESVDGYVDVLANVHGGDILTVGYTDKTSPSKTLTRFCAAWRNHSRADAIILRGNHDDNGYGPLVSAGVWTKNKSLASVIGETEWFNVAMNPSLRSRNIVYDASNPTGGYCYIDDPKSKIRTFFVNTGEIPETQDGNGNYLYTMYTHSAMSNAQINFIANALKFEDKSDATDWAVLFVSHIPLELKNTSGAIFGITDMKIQNVHLFFGVLNAYKDGTAYSGTNTTTGYEASVNVTYSRVGNVIGFICGHTHADNTANTVGGSGSPEYGYRYVSISAGNTGATITVNRTARTISVRKWGGSVLLTQKAIDTYHMIVGLTSEDVNEYGDFTVPY